VLRTTASIAEGSATPFSRQQSMPKESPTSPAKYRGKVQPLPGARLRGFTLHSTCVFPPWVVRRRYSSPAAAGLART